MFPQDIGAGKGKYYAVNFPLRDGIDDDAYERIFNPVCMYYFSMHLPHKTNSIFYGYPILNQINTPSIRQDAPFRGVPKNNTLILLNTSKTKRCF